MFNLEHQLIGAIHKVEDKYNKKLDSILTELKLHTKELKRMSQEFDTLTAQVQANNDAIDSAVVLINGIADRISAAGTDPTKLNALTSELKAKDQVLADAVAANTPAA